MNEKKHIVIFSGAGISAESGIKTFRGEDGLWEGYRVEDVATYEAWCRDPELVLDFYNQRRIAVAEASPNTAHFGLVRLENDYEVTVITQNIDNLHERAGSKKVVHLHGEIFKSQSTADPNLIYQINGNYLNIGDKCELGSQLRPYIVWFGEAVPMMQEAIEVAKSADIFIVIGSSLVVYPAASLINFVNPNTSSYIVDPNASQVIGLNTRITQIQENASSGVAILVDRLLDTA